MSTRITQSMMQRQTLADLNAVASRLSRTQQRLSSGREITAPSDDPYGTGRAIALRAEVAGLQQYGRNTGEALAWQDVSDSALAKISDAAQRARELVVQGANDAAGQSARNAAAGEIEQLIDAIKQTANVRYAGRHVFSGTQTATPPWTVGPADAFAGDGNPIAREIGPGVSLQVNVDLHAVLGDGQPANDSKLLDVLRDAVQHLRGGTAADLDALRTLDLQGLDTGLDALAETRGSIGAVSNRLESAAARLAQMEEAATRLLSEVEDADMAKTITDFTTQQAVYQSALKAGANIVQQSLLDFLR